MLYLDDPPFVCPSLLQLMSPVAGSSRCFAVGGCAWVKHSYIKECTTPTAVQKFWAFTSNLAPSSVLVLLCGKVSPVSGCRVGSMATLGQTFVRNCASKSLMRLCRIDGMAPVEQLSAWLRLTVSPARTMWRGVCRAATHTSHIINTLMLRCEEYNYFSCLI